MNIQDVLKKEDDKVIFTKPYGQVEIPEGYFDKKLAVFVVDKLEVFGIFQLYVWDDYDLEDTKNKPVVFSIQVPCRLLLSPRSYKEEVKDGKRVLILEFMNEDVFIQSTKIIQTVLNVESAFNILFNNFIPPSMDYDDVINFIENSSEINKINLKATIVNIEMIVMKMCKNPNNYSEDFRKILAKDKNYNKKNFKVIRLMDAAKYENAFQAITSANPMVGIMKSISDSKKGRVPENSPVEDSIY